MTEGLVNADLEATVPIVIIASDGEEIALAAVGDTGFSAYLALPSSFAVKYGLRSLLPRIVKLGDGSRKSLEYFEGEVLWSGKLHRIRILGTVDECLIGVGLLEELRLEVTFRVGERVLIKSA
jgi:predicted aspartyl protease